MNPPPLPPFLKLEGKSRSNSNASAADSGSTGSPRVSFRDKYQLSSSPIALSPIHRSSADESFAGNDDLREISDKLSGDLTSNKSTHLIPAQSKVANKASTRGKPINLQEILQSRKERMEASENKKSALAVDFSDMTEEDANAVLEAHSPRKKSGINLVPYEDSPGMKTTSEKQYKPSSFNDLPSEPRIHSELERIKQSRPVLSEESTAEKVQEILERRKKRKSGVQANDVENDEYETPIVDESNVQQHEIIEDVADDFNDDIVNEFLSKSNMSDNIQLDTSLGKEESLLPERSAPSIPEEISEPKSPHEQPRISKPLPAEQKDSMSPRSLRFTENQTPPAKLSSPFVQTSPMERAPFVPVEYDDNERRDPLLSHWRITTQRWNMFITPSVFSKETMQLLTGSTGDDHNTMYAKNIDDISESSYTETGQDRRNEASYPTFQRKNTMENSNPLDSFGTAPVLKFKNLEELYNLNYEVPADNGAKRPAFKYEISNNFARSLKSNPVWFPFMKDEEMMIAVMVNGVTVYKNTPQGKVHQRFLYIDPKNREIMWSNNDKKKGIQRSSRRVKMAEVASIKAFELTQEQAKVMGVPSAKNPQQKNYGMVIHSKSRTTELAFLNTRNEFLFITASLALTTHRLANMN